MDNVSTNNALMDYISEDLEEKKIAYDDYQYKLRCNGYIINLAICVLLFGKY